VKTAADRSTLPLAGVRCLITGASGGIGTAIATALASEGAALCLQGRDRDALAFAAARCGDTPWIAADLTDPNVAMACADVVARAEAQLGAIDALVVSSGEGWATQLPDTPAAVVERLLAVDLATPIHLTRAAVPAMIGRGNGHIVFVGSIAGRVGVAGEAVYSAAKGGLAVFADATRVELAPAGVRVSLVTPGPVDTEFFTRRGQPYARRFPRPVTPERVARAVTACLRHNHAERFSPAWLAAAPRVHGATPRLYERLARRFS
jgi:short-subunit dehydrogenase